MNSNVPEAPAAPKDLSPEDATATLALLTKVRQDVSMYRMEFICVALMEAGSELGEVDLAKSLEAQVSNAIWPHYTMNDWVRAAQGLLVGQAPADVVCETRLLFLDAWINNINNATRTTKP